MLINCCFNRVRCCCISFGVGVMLVARSFCRGRPKLTFANQDSLKSCAAG